MDGINIHNEKGKDIHWTFLRQVQLLHPKVATSK
jgi:hypothetical protein